MTPLAVRERLRARPARRVPVGTPPQHGPHPPRGCDSIRGGPLAAARSAASGILRAPAIEYGVQPPMHPLPGGAALRRKTLHRVMNELIESWEEGAGVREFMILTAQANDAHLEALSTIRTATASVVVLDVLALDFGDRLATTGAKTAGGELDTSLLLYLAPTLVADRLVPAALNASAPKGEALYRFIFERLNQRLLCP